jgi:hypothetical protein
VETVGPETFSRQGLSTFAVQPPQPWRHELGRDKTRAVLFLTAERLQDRGRGHHRFSQKLEQLAACGVACSVAAGMQVIFILDYWIDSKF